jgi:hypothetical protein
VDPSGAVEEGAAARVAIRVRATLGLATLLMLGLSWPLWVEPSDLPRVPFTRAVPEASVPASWAIFGLLLVSIAAGVARRAMLVPSMALLAVLVLQDQHRFQPWVYQFLVLGLLLATLPARQAVVFARWWLIALYFHSGLSKLDLSFCREQGLSFLATALRPFGGNVEAWPVPWRVAGVLAMPAFEIAVAAALLFRRSRRLGLFGAVLIHSILILILGPGGLRQSTIVLVWNAAMLLEVVLLFGPDLATETVSTERGTRLAPLTRGLFWVGVVLPLGERWRILDAWPAHALYASHVEQTVVFVPEDGLVALDSAVRRHVVTEGAGPWFPLDLTGWSRETRGVPVYPSGRARNGLAEGLAARYGGRFSFRVVQYGPADRWSGRRTRVECLGLEGIRRQGDRYRLNAHPAGGSRSKPR